jgi:hypothetical protein
LTRLRETMITIVINNRDLRGREAAWIQVASE